MPRPEAVPLVVSFHVSFGPGRLLFDTSQGSLSMRMTRSPKLWMSTVAVAAGLAATQVVAQDEQVVVDVRFAGLSNVEPHAKDAAAHRAVMLLGERLAEIPNETGGPDEARIGIELLWDLFRGAHALRIDRTQEAPGLGVAFTLSPEMPLDGQGYLDKLANFIIETGGPVEEAEDGYTLSTPIGLATMQSMDVGGESSMVVRLGAEAPAETAVQSYDLPDGSEPVLSAQVHLQRLGQFIAQIVAEEEPGFAEVIEDNRWIIDDAPLMNLAYGTTTDRQILTSRLVGGRAWLERFGMSPEQSFGSEAFTVVPEDATIVSAVPFELGFVVKLIEWVAEQEGEDPFGEMEEALGFDVRGDVLLNVGPRMFYYQSDATGGGGILSAVLITDLRDPARLADTHNRLVNQLNEVAANEARGYVRIRNWQGAGQEIFSFSTPGLPVPFEPSWSIVGDQLVVAASPVGIVSAIEQMTTDGPSINDNAKFKAAILDHMPERGAASVTFSDTERFARLGYGGTNLILSGLSNSVRSPVDAERDAGILMPSFSVFAEGIRPMGAIEYWEGDDYVAVMRMDGSSVVGVAEVLGQIGGLNGIVTMGAIQAGVAMPALGKARLNAQTMKSASQVRGLVQAAILYSSDNEDRVPESYDVLIEEGFITWEMLQSPAGPAYDGKGDIVLRFDFEDGEFPQFKPDIVVAMDRAAYVNGGMDVNVGFSDGHVELLGHWEVDEILDQPQNAGAREAFQLD